MITPLTEIELMGEHCQANGGGYFYFYRGDCIAVRQGYGEPWLGRGE